MLNNSTKTEAVWQSRGLFYQISEKN